VEVFGSEIDIGVVSDDQRDATTSFEPDEERNPPLHRRDGARVIELRGDGARERADELTLRIAGSALKHGSGCTELVWYKPED
jgi:hypothetical protein